MTDRPNQAGQLWGATVLRVVIGAVFVAHGAQKLFSFGLEGTTAFMQQVGVPAPGAAAALVIFLELIGGLLLVSGLLTRVIAALLAVDMTVAILTVHLPAGFFLPNGYEFVLTLLAATVSLVLLGPGAAALDSVVAKSRSAAGQGDRRLSTGKASGN